MSNASSKKTPSELLEEARIVARKIKPKEPGSENVLGNLKSFESASPFNSTNGFIFGKLGDNYFHKKEDKDGHILIVGGSGSGKTSCLAIPSLIAWKQRIFCIDIKGELHTSAKRANAKIFDPLKSITYGYDPFFTLKTTNQAQEAEAISRALILMPPETKNGFWIQSARNMLTGFILHFYKEGFTFIETIKKILSTPIDEQIDYIYDNSSSPIAKFYMNAFVSMENRTLSEVYAELSRHIMIFATDETMIRALSQSQKISPEDLEKSEDIYICIPEYLLEQWSNFLTLIISQFTRHFEKRTEVNSTPILFLLDEFPRLGKMDGIINGLATLRSKKITICPILQSLAQLDYIYGANARRVIVDNCQYKAVLSVTDGDSQEYFSKLVGTHEELNTSYGLNTTFLHASANETTNSVEKRKIKPEDFATLGDKIIVFTPFGCLEVDKAPYYEQKANLMKERD